MPSLAAADAAPTTTGAAAASGGGRRWFEDSGLVAGSIPRQRLIDVTSSSSSAPVAFPLVLELASPSSSSHQLKDRAASLEFLAAHRTEIAAAMKLHGAVLFRGLPGIETAEDFDAVGTALAWPEFKYVNGAAPRTRVFGSVHTTNEGPADTLIAWHHEVAQSMSPPGRLIFCCEIPPESGGETCVVFSPEAWRVVQDTQPEFADNLKRHGIVYSRHLAEETNKAQNAGRGWKDTFNVKTKEELEAVLKELRITGEWIEDGKILRASSPVLPGFRLDEPTGQIAFFNSIPGAFYDVLNSYGPGNSHKFIRYGGDGNSHPSEETLQGVYEAVESVGVPIPWKRGDFILVDNHLVAHERMPYSGKRKVYASLWNA